MAGNRRRVKKNKNLFFRETSQFEGLSVGLGEETIEGALKQGHMYSIATGENDGEIRVYVYARFVNKIMSDFQRAELFVMLEVKVFKEEGRSEITAKSENADFSKKMLELVEAILRSL